MRKTLVSAVLVAISAIACSSSGGGDAATTPPAPGGTTDPGATPPPPSGQPTTKPDGAGTSTAKLGAVTFQNVGRKGSALWITVKGTDPQKQTSAAYLRMFDANGNPVAKAFDTDWDGTGDAAEKRYHFDASTLGKTDFTGSITIPNAYSAGSPIAKIGVTLEDEAGKRSDEIVQDLSVQAEKAYAEACDPLKITSRCPAGMACSGTPATCAEGTAPQLASVVYRTGGGAARVLALGTDADEDYDHMQIEYLDSKGTPMTYTYVIGDNDSVTESGVDVPAPMLTYGAQFSFDMKSSNGFELHVPEIAATIYDRMGRPSERKVAVAGASTTGSPTGCDWRDPGACGSGSTCSPGLPTATNACKPITSLQTAECGGATVLDPGKGLTRAFGKAEGSSLWDPPKPATAQDSACTVDGAFANPEGVVKLHLAKAAASVTVTTALPETEFDTVLYVLPACGAAGSKALGCNDDDKGFSSTLTLSNVAAGDYLIVVDSVGPKGGRYGVSVDVK